MAYFPFFVELKGQKGLIVGGGPVACRKAEKLLPYGPALCAVAPRFCAGWAAPALAGVQRRCRPFAEADLADDWLFVIAATADTALNRRIAALCKARRIAVNVVDDPAACGFLFPALVQEGRLSVGISTSGASPTAAVWLKEQIAALLPPHFARLLDELEAQRPSMKRQYPDEAARARAFRALFLRGLAAVPLPAAETLEAPETTEALPTGQTVPPGQPPR